MWKKICFFFNNRKTSPTQEKIYCLKTKFCWHTEQRKQIKWLTSFYFSYLNRDFFQFSTEIPDSIFFSRLHIIKGELGGNGYTLGFKHQRTSVFFTLKSYLTDVFNMDFTKIQVQSYIKPSPEKGKILKQSCFLCYKLSLLFSKAM